MFHIYRYVLCFHCTYHAYRNKRWTNVWVVQTMSCLLSAVVLCFVDDETTDTSLPVLQLVIHPVDVRAEFLRRKSMALGVACSFALVLAHYCCGVFSIDFTPRNFSPPVSSRCVISGSMLAILLWCCLLSYFCMSRVLRRRRRCRHDSGRPEG